MSARKGVAQLLVILILLGIFAVVFFNFQKISDWAVRFNPPPPPYKNIIPEWKVYKNPTYKFTIEYPNQWYVRTYGDYAANFQTTDPALGEATPGAIMVKFSALTEKSDESEFLQIVNTNIPIHEPLDVISIMTKVRSFTVGTNNAVEYLVNRRFTAPEGPRGQFTHVFSVDENGTILQFFSEADTKDAEAKFDTIFQKMMATIRL